MTKAQIIAKHGEQYYVALKEAQKVARKTPEGRAKRAAYMKKWYAKKHGGVVRKTKSRGLKGVKDGSYWKQYGQLSEFKDANRARAKAAYHAMTLEERRKAYERRYAARKAKLTADREFRVEQAAKQHKRFARWDEAHPGLHRQRSIAWFKAHPEVVRAAKHARRALGKIPAAFVKFLREQPCLDCGKPSNGKATIGHLIPVSRGGTNNPLNLITQCRSCNSKQCARVHPRFAMVNYPQAARYAVAA